MFDIENVKTIVKPTKRQSTWQFETMSLIKLLTVWRFLKKLEIDMPYDPAIPLLGIDRKSTRLNSSH